MANSQIEWMVLGMVSTNTYLVKNQDTGELLIIDPADAAGRIQEKIGQMEGRPAAILLTHGHFDHMLAADALRSAYDIPVYACIQEKDLLKNARYNLSASWASPHVMEADRYLADGETFREAGFEIRLLHTPRPYGGQLLLLFARRGGAVFRGYPVCRFRGENGFSHLQRSGHEKEPSAAPF